MNTKSNDSLDSLKLHAYSSHFDFGSRFIRILWGLIWMILFRPSPIPFHGWRRMLLQLFGAYIGPHVHIYPSVRIWAPWNLTMAEGSSLAPGVDCYCVDRITIGAWTTVSQRTFLCTATHDIRSSTFDLLTAPIFIGEKAWIAAEAYIGPGIKIGDGAVVAARAVVVHNVDPWTIAGGNPAQKIAKRIIKNV